MSGALTLEGLEAGYGSQRVLHGVSIDVADGETTVVLGLNGAGKSTLLGCVAGLVPAWTGRVLLDGDDVTAVGAPERVERGIALVPEGRRVFPRLTVAENLRIGGWTRRRNRASTAEAEALVAQTFPRLAERAGQHAGTLSGGEQQMLAIGRALMTQPKLLLVDEASLGLSPSMSAVVLGAVAAVNRAGVTVVLVEQNATALAFADRAVVLEKGTVGYSGPADSMVADDLRRSYLGAA